jgi:hypothetical protein
VLDLPGLEELAELAFVGATVVADGGDVVGALAGEGLDKIVGEAAPPKPPNMMVAPS